MNHRKILKLSKNNLNLNKLIGDYGERYTCYEFAKRNYEAYFNSSEDQTDILIFGINKINRIRIQVKTSNKYLNKSLNEYYSFGVANGKHRYEKVDYFVFLGIGDTLSVEDAWIVPREKFNNYKSNSVSISINSKKYKKYKNNWNVNGI